MTASITPALVGSSPLFHLYSSLFYTWEQNGYRPADEGGDDDAPGRAAAVGVRLLLVFAPPAAQEDGVEEEEEEVQGQAGQCHASQ